MKKKVSEPMGLYHNDPVFKIPSKIKRKQTKDSKLDRKPVENNDLLKLYDTLKSYGDDFVIDICKIENDEYLLIIDMSEVKMAECILNKMKIPYVYDGSSNEYYVYIKYNNVPVF
jgi:hypothetical protein